MTYYFVSNITTGKRGSELETKIYSEMERGRDRDNETYAEIERNRELADRKKQLIIGSYY